MVNIQEKIEAGSSRKYTLHVSSVVVYGSVAVFGLISVAIDRPGTGSWWILLPLVSLPPMLHHVVMIILPASGVDAKRKRYSIPLRLITLVLGILLLRPLYNYAAAYALGQFASSQLGFITSLRESNADVCDLASQYRRSQAGHLLRGLWYKDGDYLVTFSGGSIDIDGSTIYYWKSNDKWDIVHNDTLQQDGMNHPLNKLMGEMNACEIRIN